MIRLAVASGIQKLNVFGNDFGNDSFLALLRFIAAILQPAFDQNGLTLRQMFRAIFTQLVPDDDVEKGRFGFPFFADLISPVYGQGKVTDWVCLSSGSRVKFPSKKTLLRLAKLITSGDEFVDCLGSVIAAFWHDVGVNVVCRSDR